MILWWENNTKVKTPDGHSGWVQVTRRERRLISEGKLNSVLVLGTDGVRREFQVDELIEEIPEYQGEFDNNYDQ